MSNPIIPQRIFSLDKLETVEYDREQYSHYFALSYTWRQSVEGEKGWIISDRQRDMKWRVISTKYNMILYLKEAFVNTLQNRYNNSGIWMDSLCVCQENEDEKRTEIPISRNYFANAEMCLLCPWMGFGVSREDHKKSGETWSDRSWPVQEVVISNKIGLLYNIATVGTRWILKVLETQYDVSDDIKEVYGNRFTEEIKRLLTYKIGKGNMYIEQSLRLSYNKKSRFVSDLVYAFVGMSNIDQKFGKREDNIISTLEWLYHSLRKEDRIRLLLVTANSMMVAEGTSWLPNYTDKGIIYDCDIVIHKPIAEIDEYRPGVGITVVKTVVLTIITDSVYNNESKLITRYIPEKSIFYKNGEKLYDMWCQEINKVIKGYMWGNIDHGRYKFVILGKTTVKKKKYVVAAICLEPHKNLPYIKVGLACLRYKKYLSDYIMQNLTMCKIG
jgi:hypothetical protein